MWIFLKKRDKLIISILGIDINIHDPHFIKRMNDTRNSPEIKLKELRKLFEKIFKAYGDNLTEYAKNNGTTAQGILQDLFSCQ